MKTLLALFIMGSFQTAMAADIPEVYCVSTKSFQDKNSMPVNQINIFTNKKGTAHINLQYVACNEEECGNFDSNMVQTVVGLKFDEATRTYSNSTGKLSLQLSRGSITPAAMEKILSSRKNVQESLEVPTGFKIQFKKYYLAKLLAYNIPAKKGTWAEVLNDAFTADVTDYVCGDHVDATGPTASIFDGDNEND